MKVRGTTLLLVLLTLAQVGITIWGNYWNRALFDALVQRTAHGVLAQVVGRWLDDGRHYRLQFAEAGHDNPDQRIAEDIRIATEVALAFLYALLGSLLGWVFGLSRVREHSEAGALPHGEARERDGAAVRFRQVAGDWDRQSLTYLGLVSFSTGYGALLPVFPILIAAPQ